MSSPKKWTTEKLKEELPHSRSMAELLIRLGLTPSGGSHETMRKWIKKLGLDTSHFESQSTRVRRLLEEKQPVPLEEVLVEKSEYSRRSLKERLVKVGILKEVCCLCLQGPEWRGKRMPLILDHINGVRNDNRLENLRLVCPNCNATLDTFCSRNLKLDKPVRIAQPKTGPKLRLRKHVRPPYLVLLKEVEDNGYLATGNKYGVSDVSIRKWLESYRKYGI